MKTKQLALCGLFSALMVICAWISLPFGDSPFTLQTFGLFLCLGALGGKCGTISVITYLLLGMVGFPAFSGFRGGIGALLDVTGGYLVGFLVAALLYWLITSVLTPSPTVRLFSMILGLLSCYIFGTVWFWAVYAQTDPVTLPLVLIKCVLPYLLPDAMKLLLAWQLSGRLSKFIN